MFWRNTNTGIGNRYDDAVAFRFYSNADIST